MGELETIRGRVAKLWPNKAYGFVRAEGVDYFFHKDDCSIPWDSLTQGMVVSIVVVESPKGPRCYDVTPIEVDRSGETHATDPAV